MKDKYFNILVREETMIKYNIRAYDEEHAMRIFKKYNHTQDRHIVAQDKHIIEIEESVEDDNHLDYDVTE